MFFYRKRDLGAARRRRANIRALQFEVLERRELLSINWINKGHTDPNDPTNPQSDTDHFNQRYGPNADLARSIAQRAIDDWDAVISNFNYPEDSDSNANNNLNNTFSLTITATQLGSGERGTTLTSSNSFDSAGIPESATVEVDDDGAGNGWFFDPTPGDDAEFTAIANSGMNGNGPAFSASFVNVYGQSTREDFYRTVVHEIGHAMGINNDPSEAITPMLTALYQDSGDTTPLIDPTGFSNTQLYRFNSTLSSPQFPGVTATFLGNHLYEGDLYGTNNDPTSAFPSGSSTSVAFVSHPNELMNTGRTDPAGDPDPSPPNETLREFISDLDAEILADAYGYTVTLPSQTNTANASLDSLTGTLLVQGPVNSAGSGMTVPINIDTVSVNGATNIRVQVNYGSVTTQEQFPAASVTNLVICLNGGTLTPTIGTGVPKPNYVQYVVSSNQDTADTGNTAGDLFVDQSTVIPGRQTSLRAAIHDANAVSGSTPLGIYVPRGDYQLTIAGLSDSGNGDTMGDLDISKNITIVGTGSGETIVDASTLTGTNIDRVFNVKSGGTLTLDDLTVTGGQAPDANLEFSGGGIFVRSGGTLNLNSAAVVGNRTDFDGGGGIYFDTDSGGSISNSLIANNTAESTSFGGGVYLKAGNGGVSITNTVIANNKHGTTPDDVFAGRAVISGGNNRLTVGANGFLTSLSDYVSPGTIPIVVTDVGDTLNTSNNPNILSVREAIESANGGNQGNGTPEIWLPAWRFLITIPDLTGGGGANAGDYDLSASMAIRGIGPGETILDASSLRIEADGSGQTHPDRIFSVLSNVTLDLSGVTLTGGSVTGVNSKFNGGAIFVANFATLKLANAAIVGNQATFGAGGGIYIDASGGAAINSSVLTRNSSVTGSAGGIYLADGSTQNVSVATSILAQNLAGAAVADVFTAGTARNFMTGGNNRLTSAPNGAGFANGLNGDVVSSSVSEVATSLGDEQNPNDDNVALTLREAVAAADNVSGTQFVWLPAWHFLLTGGELSIRNQTKNLYGLGPGFTVIDGSSPTATQNRLFEVQNDGNLDLFSLTLTGGHTTGNGGAILVHFNSNNVHGLVLSSVAVVANTAAQKGGGIFVDPGTMVAIVMCVITDNTAQATGVPAGGGIYADAFNTAYACVSLKESVIANNLAPAPTATEPDLANATGDPPGMFASQGGNMITNRANVNITTLDDGSTGTDYTDNTPGFVPPNYVVTSLADVAIPIGASTADLAVLTVREAVQLVDGTSGTQTLSIWLPAWQFVLTIDRGSNPTDYTPLYGDLDISHSVVIRGVIYDSNPMDQNPPSVVTGVHWTPTVNDKVFELLGDYNGDGLVNAADYTVWRDTLNSTSNLAADGNDDRVIDQQDYDIWNANYGHMQLINVNTT
jgi:hypothetical protein